MNNEHIITTWEKHGSTGILTLTNPPDNPIKEPEFTDINDLMEKVSDPELKGMIIKGNGRHFSAGADMKILREMARNPVLLTEKISLGKKVISLIESLPIPVIASVSGACFGAGLEIALACHLRILSTNALLAFPETNYGIMPGMGGTIMLSELIGSGKSAEIILSGNIIDAEKALRMGIADYTVPKGELHNFTLDFLNKLTGDRDLDVIKSVMMSIHNAKHMTFADALKEETRLFCDLAVKSMMDNDDPE